jgi:alanine racemase
VVEYDIAPFVADSATISLLGDAAKGKSRPFPVHLKIDTGMGRIGCTPREAPDLAEQIDRDRNLYLEGTCTHFPRADGVDQSFTRYQLDLFLKAVEEIRKRGIDPGLLHAANSGAILGLQESHLDMVRPGIILYGYYPSKEQPRPLDIKPVYELETEIFFLKKVPADTPVSYGSTYHTREETYIATLPIGYGDGYSRLLSNSATVLIKGNTYPLVGRVCMDQIMVDLGHSTDVKLYDRAVLFGPDPTGPTAETLAALIDTIPYEITCAVSKRVPRIFIDGDE